MLRRLAARDDRLWRWFALFMLLSPQLFWGWSREPARSDMLICGIIAWSLIAGLGGRFFIPMVLLFIGSLIHETAIIYGGPMLVAMWYVVPTPRRSARSRAPRCSSRLQGSLPSMFTQQRTRDQPPWTQGCGTSERL